MKRLFLFVAVVVSAFSAIASDQFYVIMKDGSAVSYPSEKVDSITFDDPNIANANGFKDLQLEIDKLKKEIEALKSNQGNRDTTSVEAPISGYVDGYAYVDLGLTSGLKWATMNVGASTKAAYGNYYAWGEVAPAPLNDYSKENCKAYGNDVPTLKENGVLDANGNLTAEYDAATQNWGENWRMPTKAEYDELLKECIWTRVAIGGVRGYKVESGWNGNWIFLPAAGYRFGTSSSVAGSDGDYWSSTVLESDSNNAYYLYFNSSSKNTSSDYRFVGHSVRPVSE